MYIPTMTLCELAERMRALGIPTSNDFGIPYYAKNVGDNYRLAEQRERGGYGDDYSNPSTRRTAARSSGAACW